MADEPLWLQNLRYDAREDRGLIADLFTEGVADLAAHFRVTPRAQGANMSVDVQPGVGYVTGDEEPGQGRYRVKRSAPFNLPIPPELGNRRGDLIVGRVYDDNVTGARKGFFIERVPGVPAPSPLGAFAVPAVPPTAIALAEVYVRPGMPSIVAADILDRRVGSGFNVDYRTSTRVSTPAGATISAAPYDFNHVTVSRPAPFAVTASANVYLDLVNDGSAWSLSLRYYVVNVTGAFEVSVDRKRAEQHGTQHKAPLRIPSATLSAAGFAAGQQVVVYLTAARSSGGGNATILGDSRFNRLDVQTHPI